MRKMILLTLLLPSFGFAQNWEDVQIKTTQVKDNIYYLEGRGGNVGVLVGSDGVLLIDDQFAPLSDKIAEAVTEISTSDISYVANTHYHGDHTGGNENFKTKGATIIGHINVRKRLGTTFENTLWNKTTEAKPETFWPEVTFGKDSTIQLFDQTISFVYLPDAHTDGDALIHFEDANVIHTGDCFVRYGYPFIDISAGGTIDGMIKAHERILSIADKNTIIIPGHGKLATIEEVKEVLTMLKETREIVASEKAKGTALEDLIPLQPLRDYHERWNGNFITSDLFVQIIFESI